MALTHTSLFKVRHYECDPYGHVSNANYLRYMQEAAFEASDAVGYSVARYDTLGLLWLARETEIEYLQPVKYGDTVAVKTWVADWRRVRSRRMYEFSSQSTGQVVARGSTDWVLIDRNTQQPASITPEMVRAYSGGEDAPPAEARPKLPAPPPPPPGIVRSRRLVEWRDIDTAQHVNNAVYINYLEDGAFRAAEAYGWPFSRWQEEGIGIVARRHHLDYKQPAVFGDELEIATWVSDVRTTSATRYYTISRVSDGEALVTARTVWVWISLETSRPIRIPEHMMADFAGHISATGSEQG